MLLDRHQHIEEAARHVRPDRFLLERTYQRRDGLLIGGNREMVRPEMDEALAKRRVGAGREFVSAGRLSLILRADETAIRPLFGVGALLAVATAGLPTDALKALKLAQNLCRTLQLVLSRRSRTCRPMSRHRRCRGCSRPAQ